ncbi:hypothetical protein WN944_006483 [Citrus x changshan-huyou]|uniref:Uncharacterized protein n=1 Tax=Citrus x changshan-huyou TaxID=2935761 RepID=A0AAP0MP16_9ROSI
MQAGRKKPIAAFMAFGTKGDVYPIAAIAAPFASDQRQYDVFLITHSAHEEGWSLAELFRVRCIVAAPYVVPYSAPASFEHHFIKEHPLLYKYLEEAPINKSLSFRLAAKYVTFIRFHHRLCSVLLIITIEQNQVGLIGVIESFYLCINFLSVYGSRYVFSKEIVECPVKIPLSCFNHLANISTTTDYWPSSVWVCGFSFLPNSWQYSCKQCGELSAFLLDANNRLCASHIGLQAFTDAANSTPPIFVGLSSAARQSFQFLFFSMGFLKNPEAFLRVLQTVLHTTTYRFVLFTAGYEPLDTAIRVMAPGTSSVLTQRVITQYGISIFDGKLFCFSGMVPYKYLFPRCVAAIHHGGSAIIFVALMLVTLFLLDVSFLIEFQEWFVEYCLQQRFFSLMLPFVDALFAFLCICEPLKRNHLVPDNVDDTSIKEAAEALSQAIQYALSPRVKECAKEIAESMKEAAEALSQAIQYALSPRVKECAKEIAERISVEDGVSEAVKNLNEEMGLF